MTLIVCNPPCACDTSRVSINPKATTGVNNLNSNAFRVYPNPAGNQLFVEGNSTIQIMLVTDMMGRELLRLKPDQSLKLHMLNLSGLAPGQYLLKVQSTESEQHTRIIKR